MDSVSIFRILAATSNKRQTPQSGRRSKFKVGIYLVYYTFRSFVHNSSQSDTNSFRLSSHAARQQHCIQSGKLASMQEFSFPSYYDMTIVGNFVVGRANAHELHLSWHQLAVPGGAVLHTKEIPLKKVWRVHVVLMYLEMNHEGMLLLRLRETGKDRARYVW